MDLAYSSSQCLISLGLIIDIIGVVILTRGFIISKKEAIELGKSRYAGETDEENLKLPAVQALLRDSRSAKIGLICVGIGFILQLIGNVVA